MEEKVFFPLLTGKVKVMGFETKLKRFRSKTNLDSFITDFTSTKGSGVVIDVCQDDNGIFECLYVDSILRYKIVESSKIYQPFNNLKITSDLATYPSELDKLTIIGFLENFSALREFQAEFHDITNTFRRADVATDINYFFIPFLKGSKPDFTFEFFREFQKELVQFQGVVSAVANGKAEEVFGIIDSHLKHIHPATRPTSDEADSRIISMPHWQVRSLLDWCYFELYVDYLRQESVKTCKYCGNLFFSSKSNRVCCHDCSATKSQYKKRYYQKHIDEIRSIEKARIKSKREL